MTISFTKEPSGIYPAFNDSFIEFSSDLADNNRAEITVYPTATFNRVFLVYPDSDGNYVFNLKECVKVIVNELGFADSNFFTDAYYKNISDILFLNNQVDIAVISDATEESTTKYYDFYKAVKQVGESVFSNEYQILSFSEDGTEFNLTYWEGFPFHFDIKKVTLADSIKVKNTNDSAETVAMAATATESFRINIDRGGSNNWTDDAFLTLYERLNVLQVLEGVTVKATLNLTKKKKSCGVYLKWWNSEGGFSHFLFDEFYTKQIQSESIGTILNNHFNNIADLTGFSNTIGKNAEESILVKARYTKDEYNILRDLFISPKVQLYTSREAYVSGEFIDVTISGSFSHSTKREFNEIVLTVNLPEMVTAKL